MGRLREARIWTAAVTLLVMMGSAIALESSAWRGAKPAEGLIVGMMPVSKDAAVLVWSRGDDDASWVGRIDGHGDLVWLQRLPDVAMSIGGTGPLTIVDGVVVVRYGHRVRSAPTDSSAIAFDLGDGHPLWDHVLAPYTPRDGASRWSGDPHLPLYVSDVASGRALVSFADSGGGGVMTRTIARTGVVSWSRQSPDPVAASPIVFGDAIALHDAFDASLIGGDGAVQTLQTRGTGCAVGNEYLAVEDLAHVRSHRLVAYASANAAPRVIAAHFDVFDGHPFIRACGHHGDDLVFLVEVDRDEALVVEAIVTDRGGKLLHRIELGPQPLIMESSLFHDPDHAIFGGDLPRFVPFPDGRTRSLVMVDLETGAIAWRGKPDPTLLYGALFHVGTRWIWTGGEVSRTVSVFDGTTGVLSAAVTASSDHGVLTTSETRPSIATSDSLWLHAGDWTTPDAASIAVLDLPTLAPRFVRGIQLTDATAAVRSELGL